jgi:hypothetical protein
MRWNVCRRVARRRGEVIQNSGAATRNGTGGFTAPRPTEDQEVTRRFDKLRLLTQALLCFMLARSTYDITSLQTSHASAHTASSSVDISATSDRRRERSWSRTPAF